MIDLSFQYESGYTFVGPLTNVQTCGYARNPHFKVFVEQVEYYVSMKSQSIY